MKKNKSIRQHGCLIATHSSGAHSPRILADNILIPFDEVDFKSFNLNFDDLVGGGWEINFYTLTAEPENVEQSIISVKHNGGRQNYRLEECGQRFPLIEGEVEPSIYFLSGEGYFTVSDSKDLTAMLNSLYNHEISGEMKFVYQLNSISWFESANGKLLETLVHYPLNYFDLHCPLCRQKVVRFESTSTNNGSGDVVECSCMHYLGLAVTINNEYEEADFDYLGLSYQFIHKKLYLKNINGEWEKALIYKPKELLGSYWNEFDSSSIFANHFLFSESGNVRRTKNNFESSL